MKISGPQVISELREKLQFEVGRHLYGVLGTYARLAKLEQIALSQALDPQGNHFPLPINVNRELLGRIGDEDLRRLVRDEARGRRPSSAVWARSWTAWWPIFCRPDLSSS